MSTVGVGVAVGGFEVAGWLSDDVLVVKSVVKDCVVLGGSAVEGGTA